MPRRNSQRLTYLLSRLPGKPHRIHLKPCNGVPGHRGPNRPIPTAAQPNCWVNDYLGYQNVVAGYYGHPSIQKPVIRQLNTFIVTGSKPQSYRLSAMRPGDLRIDLTVCASDADQTRLNGWLPAIEWAPSTQGRFLCRNVALHKGGSVRRLRKQQLAGDRSVSRSLLPA